MLGSARSSGYAIPRMSREVEDARWVRWFEARSPDWANVAGSLICMTLVARAMWSQGRLTIAAGVGLAGLTSALFLRRSNRLADLALVLLPSLAFARSGADAIDLRQALAPFVAQAPGQMPLLLLRVGLFLFALLEPKPLTQGRAAALSCLALVMVGSLFAQGLWLVMLLATILVVSRQSVPRVRGPSRWGAAFLLATALVGLAPHWSASPARSTPDSPPALVQYWRERGNLFRARAAALAWARQEPVPGEGYLTLADLVWELGHEDRARRVLEKVIAHPASDQVRRQAEDRLSRWGRR